jgi:hypothetical protein
VRPDERPMRKYGICPGITADKRDALFHFWFSEGNSGRLTGKMVATHTAMKHGIYSITYLDVCVNH